MTPWPVTEALAILERVADSSSDDPVECRSMVRRLWQDETLVHWLMDRLKVLVQLTGGRQP